MKMSKALTSVLSEYYNIDYRGEKYGNEGYNMVFLIPLELLLHTERTFTHQGSTRQKNW